VRGFFRVRNDSVYFPQAFLASAFQSLGVCLGFDFWTLKEEAETPKALNK
jgi:hypothetical protein